MPQPLNRACPGKRPKPIFDYNAFRRRRNLAVSICHVINVWSRCESIVFDLACLFVKAEYLVVYELLAAIQSDRARLDAIKSAAREALDDTDLHLFLAVLRAITPLKKLRNEFAHHLWGTSDELPNDLLLINPKYLSRHMYTLHDRIKGGNESRAVELDHSKIFVYRKKDLHDAVRQADHAIGLVVSLYGHFDEDAPQRDEALAWLRNDPQVQRELQRLSPQNDPSAPL